LAATKGHLEIVKLLIPVSDPKAGGSYALRLAAENGHLEIVKLLIPVSDPEVVKELGLN
jgi:ankyrin repeat protein